MKFTDNPFEQMMQEVPRSYPQEMNKAPHGSPCRGCTFWRGHPCMGTCYRKLKLQTSGHVVPKSGGTDGTK